MTADGRLTRKRSYRFAIVPEPLLYSELSDRAKVLWACLARHADVDSHAFPGYPLLAEHLHCGRASVRRAMGELEAAGWVKVTARYRDDGGQAANDYVLHDTPIAVGDRSVLEPPLSTLGEGATSKDARPPSPPARDQEEESLEREPEERDLAAPPPEVSLAEIARELTREAWKRREHPPGTSFIGTARVVEGFLKVGRSEAELRRALLKTPAFTANCLEFTLNQKPKRGAHLTEAEIAASWGTG